MDDEELKPEDLELDFEDEYEDEDEDEKKPLTKLLLLASLIIIGIIGFVYFQSSPSDEPTQLDGTDLENEFSIDNDLDTIPTLSNDLGDVPDIVVKNELPDQILEEKKSINPDEFDKLIRQQQLKLPSFNMQNESISMPSSQSNVKLRKMKKGIVYKQKIQLTKTEIIPSPVQTDKINMSQALIDQLVKDNQSVAVSDIQLSEQKSSSENNLIETIKSTGNFSSTRAYRLPNRDLFLTKGAFLDCTLETAINSTLSGMVSCRVTRNIFSTSGQVLLIERGSRITGEYTGGLQKGQARIFAMWNRVETPNGVLIDISSPGTDPLGRTGHDGYLESHFWKKFGAAILVSFIDTTGKAMIDRLKKSTVQLASGADQSQNVDIPVQGNDELSLKVLEDYQNMPDILYKNQGEHISIYVAKDLDFRGVYELKKRD